MAAGISASFSLIVCFLVCSSEVLEIPGAEKITAKHGQDVILPCKVPNKYNIKNIAVEWSRSDQKPEYVLLHRGERLDPDYQHPSYQNRVDLQDKEKKDGNFSLILKNVKMEDNGTYICRVFEKGKNEPISNITLEVHLSGDKDGIIGDRVDKDGGNKDGGNKDGGNKDGGNKDGGNKDGGNKTIIIVGAVVGVILLAMLASVGFLIYRRHETESKPLSSY